MNKLLLFSLLSIVSITSKAQTDSFYLHKFAQNIGREIYRITHDDKKVTYDIDFRFVDRSSPVPLKAKLVMTEGGEPASLYIKGNTSRFSTINDTIKIIGPVVSMRVGDSIKSSPYRPLTFPVAGYSPGTVQMALLQYWKIHGRPKTIHMLPAGDVSISLEGKDTLTFMNNRMILDRFVIGGLIWGNEIAWTDNTGNLMCLITNDAEGDKLEMMRAKYELLLPELISRAATYGMQLFSSSMKMDVSKNKILAIVGGNVVDVDGQSVMKNATIIIENGIITAVGPAATIPLQATVIHAEGKTILPGLWDMHAHFQQAEWGPAYLASGVTTVRDCGNEFSYINAIKAAIDAHKGVGPLILKAGIIDGPGPAGIGIVRASTPAEAVAVVHMYKNSGFAQIKIYSSVTPAVVRAITDEAHRVGLTVTGHIPEGMTTRAGIDSGMDQVNHIQYIYKMMKRRPDKSVDLNDSVSIAALNYLKAHNVVVDPTIGVMEMIFRSTKGDVLDWEPNYYTIPVSLQLLFSTMGMPDGQAKAFKPMLQGMMDVVKAMHDKGITIVAGTDMGFPGYSLPRELELYVQSGLTPMEAIRTATIIPATVMGMAGRSGSIQPAKQADLVILNADPLTNIRNTRNVWMVIKEGQVYDPASLHKMVGFK